MEVTCRKQYPDLSRVSDCISILDCRDRVFPSYLIYVALFLDALPNDSLIVYAGPYRGWSLVALAPFLELHRVILVENYRGEPDDKYRHLLSDSVREVSPTIDLELIEDDFTQVWPTLSDVDFLLLDGPPNTTNFDPFSDNFIFMMHDINQRLRNDYPGDSLVSYVPYLCRADDMTQFVDIPDDELHPALKAYQNMDRDSQMYKEFGPHGWLIGEKA